MKRFVIKVIKMYQKMSPKRLSEVCRFTPSCSEYMILSISKYGITKGIYKGIKRIFRCKYPNGGIDYP